MLVFLVSWQHDGFEVEDSCAEGGSGKVGISENRRSDNEINVKSGFCV